MVSICYTSEQLPQKTFNPKTFKRVKVKALTGDLFLLCNGILCTVHLDWGHMGQVNKLVFYIFLQVGVGEKGMTLKGQI